MSDILQPNHYQLVDGVEARDIIREVVLHLGVNDGWAGYCLGNVLKYRLRAGKKDDVIKDLEKAEVYAAWYNEHMKELRESGGW